jgi:short-subunit dehydrogenase
VKGAIVIFGATSSIARAIAQCLAARGRHLILAARDTDEADRIAGDLRLRFNVEVATVVYDALDFEMQSDLAQRCVTMSDGALGGVVMAQGYMVMQSAAQADSREARAIIDVNYSSPALLLNGFADHFEQRKSGFICGVSSVAGDRGRQSNYLYGSAKAAFTAYLSGLRNRLTRSGVPVITVKPGFVDTAMTWGLPGMFLVASPAKVAKDICRAIDKGRATIYTPWFWWGIMTIIRYIPEPIFRRMKL